MRTFMFIIFLVAIFCFWEADRIDKTAEGHANLDAVPFEIAGFMLMSFDIVMFILYALYKIFWV